MTFPLRGDSLWGKFGSTAFDAVVDIVCIHCEYAWPCDQSIESFGSFKPSEAQSAVIASVAA